METLILKTDRESSLHANPTVPGVAELLTWLGIPSGIAVLGIFAQSTFDWENIQNVTGLVAIIVVALFLVVKFLPSIQDHNLKVTAEHTAAIKSLGDNHSMTMKTINDSHTSVIQKMEEEHSILLKSIVMDHKESLKHLTEQLVKEKRDQRESMQAHYDLQTQRIITILTQNKMDVATSSVLKQATKHPSNPKGET